MGQDLGVLILVRHTDVAPKYRGVCYGISDVELSETGLAQCKPLASRLALFKPALVFHSGLSRTRVLAELLAEQACAPLPRLAHYGSLFNAEVNLTRLSGSTWRRPLSQLGNRVLSQHNQSPRAFRIPAMRSRGIGK